MIEPKRYLGDGVYVEFDGYSLELTTERAHGIDRITLEPAVYRGLIEFVTALREEIEKLSQIPTDKAT